MWLGVILSSLVILAFWFWSLTVFLAEASKTNVASDTSLQKLNEFKKEAPGLWQSLSAGIGNIIDTAKMNLNNSSPSATPVPSAEGQREKLPIE